MLLSKDSIQKLLKENKIRIEPPTDIKEASVKIHISDQFSLMGDEYHTYSEYILKPKEFVLAQTKEKITLSEKIAGLYDGYTHLARKGIITHLGSMLINPDTNGYITLEIFNASDREVVLKEGDRVGQIMFLEIK